MAFFSGTNGLIAKLVLLGDRSTRSSCGPRRSSRATTSGWRSWWSRWPRAAIDVIYMIPRESLIPAKFLIPGTMFLIGVHAHPDRLHDQHRVHELLDGAHPVEERGDRERSSEHSLADERRDVHHLARPQRRRQARAAPRRRHERQDLRRHADGLKQLPSGRDDPADGDHGAAGDGLQALQGAALFSLDRELDAIASRSPAASARSIREGARDRGGARSRT